MKKFFIVIVVLFNLPFVSAGEKKKHRQHGAHTHGSATVDIAFDQLQGTVELKSAAQAILGFEHEARTEKDKKALSDAVVKFENEIGAMIQFDPKLGCIFKKDEIAMVASKHSSQSKNSHKHHAEHWDFIANFKVECQKSVMNSRLSLDFSKAGSLNEVAVTVLVADIQKAIQVKKTPVTIDLK